MSKAEERALEKYPDHLFPTPGNGLVGPKDYEREIYIEGYEQAEKDIVEFIKYRIDFIIKNKERGYWIDAVSELEDIIDLINK